MSTSWVRRSVLRLISSTACVSYETMPPAPPSDRELDAYREQADRFIAQLDEEFYLHYAGLKETFDLAPIYERHKNLTELDQVKSIGLAVNGGARVRELWRFACEGYFGELTRDHAEKLAELESELQVDVNGEQIPYRIVRPALANEPDRDKRRNLDGRATDILDEHMNPLHLDAAQVVQQGARELGFENYLELYRKALPPSAIDELAAQCRAFLESTERLYEDAADKLFHDRVGVSLAEAKRWDVPRLFRAPEWDPMFPADRMVPALESTLADLGIDLKSQENVTLDLEERPNKSPRAFCAPIEVPDPHAGLPAPERVRGRRGDRSSVLRAAVRGEDRLRARVPRGRGRDDDAFALRGAALGCTEDRRHPRELPRGHRLRLLRLLLSPLMGVRGAAPCLSEGEVRHQMVRHARRRLAPARALGRRPEDAGRRDAERGYGLDTGDGGSGRACQGGARLVSVLRACINSIHVQDSSPDRRGSRPGLPQ